MQRGQKLLPAGISISLNTPTEDILKGKIRTQTKLRTLIPQTSLLHDLRKELIMSYQCFVTSNITKLWRRIRQIHRWQCQYQSQYQDVYMYDDLNQIKTKITKKKNSKGCSYSKSQNKIICRQSKPLRNIFLKEWFRQCDNNRYQ